MWFPFAKVFNNLLSEEQSVWSCFIITGGTSSSNNPDKNKLGKVGGKHFTVSILFQLKQLISSHSHFICLTNTYTFVDRNLKFDNKGKSTSIMSTIEVKVFSTITPPRRSGKVAARLIATAPPSDRPKAI
jgi:hypothetical protein